MTENVTREERTELLELLIRLPTDKRREIYFIVMGMLMALGN